MQGKNVLSPNQIIAVNLECFRKIRRWSLRETVRRLKPLLGYEMSAQALWEWEKSADGKKIHRFDADEIVALARLFDVPIGILFGPHLAFIKGRVVVNNKPNVKGAVVRSEPLTRLEMPGFALPKRNEQAQRAAEEWYKNMFIEQSFRAVFEYLREDRVLAEHVATEALRGEPTATLARILGGYYQRFQEKQRQKAAQREATIAPYQEEMEGREVLAIMQDRPEFREALRPEFRDGWATMNIRH